MVVTTRMPQPASPGCRTCVPTEENPVASEFIVHDLMGLIRIECFPQTDELVLDKRVHRIEHERPNGLRATRGLQVPYRGGDRRRVFRSQDS